MPMSWSLALLGPFVKTSVGQQNVVNGTLSTSTGLRRKERALLAYLVATGQSHYRQTLAGMFCREADVPMRALRLLLSRIRRHLGADAILTLQDTVQFNKHAGWVDCLEFGLILEGNLAVVSLEQLATAVALYRGEFLADTSLDDALEFELWLLGERARLRQLYERGLTELVTRLIAQERYQPAIQFSQQLLQSNPLLEEAHAQLIWLYAQTGQREAALKQYESSRDLLWRELAVEPMPELKALYAEVVAGRPTIAFKTTPDNRAAVALSQAPDFVGREAELARLYNIWSAVWDGQGGVVLVEAEAGGGKTRLVQEFARNLPQGSFLIGRCYESTTTLPYHPWIEVLETRLTDLDDSGLKGLSPFTQNYLTRLLPALAQRLRRNVSSPPPTSSDELERLFAAVGEFLFQLPGKNKVLLIFIDDLQWADETSLRLFHFIARRAVQSRLLLIGAFRSEEIEEGPLPILLSDLQRLSPYRIPLTPLSPIAIGTLTAKQWPKLPEGERPQVVARLAQATGGNPLFVSEVLRELAGTIQVPAELPVPATVRELIGRRLAYLPHSGRQVIEALSIFHSSATLTEAQEVSTRSEEETALAIDLGLRRGLLRAEPESRPARYDFHHDLVREAVVEQLSHARRELLHRRVARTLEQYRTKAALLAYHWGMAGDTTKEGYFAALAGEEAAAVYANDEAVHYLERALQLINEQEKQLHIMVRLGDVYQLLGRQQEAGAVYRQALRLAETTADHRIGARCQVALGRLARLKSQYAEALIWLEKAQTTYGALADEPGLAQTLGGMGAVYWSQLDYPRALICFQRQLNIAQRLDDQRGIGAAVGSMGVVYAEQGDYVKALTCYAQRLQIDLELNDRLSLAKTTGNMGIVYANQGEYDLALACYHSLLRVTLELGDRQNVCVALGNMIAIYTAQRQYETAERLAQQALTLGRALNIPLYLCEYLQHSAELFARQEQYGLARSQNDEALNMAAQIGQTDVQLPAQLLSVRLRLIMHEVDGVEAVKHLRSLLPLWAEDHQQAAILYELWHIHNIRGSDDTPEREAAVCYEALYRRTPNLLYWERYQEITGKKLPDPSPLPALPAIITADPVDLEALMQQVDQLIAQL